MSGARGMYRLLTALERARQQLRSHELYDAIETPEDIQVFMEHHVFAVWDFMCLLKSLQRSLTCVDVPWFPVSRPEVRRLINEIVLEEETDDIPGLGCYSHYELYRAAMVQAGADTSRVDAFLAAVGRGEDPVATLSSADAPLGVHAFVGHTLSAARTNAPHVVAAALTFGREELIPVMFRNLVERLGQRFPGRYDLLNIYLDRHIHLDEGHHTEMVVEVLAELCGEDLQKWDQAREAAVGAVVARLALWSAITSELALNRIGVLRLQRA